MSRRASVYPASDPPSAGVARAASLADVAKLAGVSAGTVSRSLYRPQMISGATRERVQDAVDRLGYLANGAARALTMRRTMTVGAVVPRFGSSSFPALVQSLETRMSAQGYTLLLSAPDQRGPNAASVLRALLERGVDAVALLGVEQPASVLNLLHAHAVPYVLMWAPPNAEGRCIGFDEPRASRLLVEHLHGLGHRNVAYIGAPGADSERARRRFNDLTRAMAACGMRLCNDGFIEIDHGFGEGFTAMRAILPHRAQYSAVICSSDYLAAGALAALDQAGIAVPGELSVASFNDNEFAAFVHPPLTTVRLPIRELGEQAANYLLAYLRDEPLAPPTALPVHLQIRASTGPTRPGATA